MSKISERDIESILSKVDYSYWNGSGKYQNIFNHYAKSVKLKNVLLSNTELIFKCLYMLYRVVLTTGEICDLAKTTNNVRTIMDYFNLHFVNTSTELTNVLIKCNTIVIQYDCINTNITSLLPLEYDYLNEDTNSMDADLNELKQTIEMAFDNFLSAKHDKPNNNPFYDKFTFEFKLSIQMTERLKRMSLNELINRIKLFNDLVLVYEALGKMTSRLEAMNVALMALGGTLGLAYIDYDYDK